jgi:hypothetical protein
MSGLFKILLAYVWSCFQSRERLKAEIIALRHQLNILGRKVPKRPRLSGGDRTVFVWLYRLFPQIADAFTVVRPETVVGWHRAGFRTWWRWKSRNPGGRPKVDQELRDMIRQMCRENPLWGAPRIHGELLKLGFEIAQATVSKYMVRGSRPSSQGWKTFLRNNADAIAAVDFLVVPTITFERLFAFVVLGIGRRRIL